jgi:hypothetical protein
MVIVRNVWYNNIKVNDPPVFSSGSEAMRERKLV